MNSAALKTIKERTGFTLIELMISVTVVGILSAVALPLYRTQVIKARMTEGTRAASLVVSSIGDYWREEGAWPPACKDVTEISNTLGVAISTNRYLKKVSTSNEGTIKVIYKNINTQVDDNGLLLRPTVNANGSIAWTWVSSGVPAKYVPRPH